MYLLCIETTVEKVFSIFLYNILQIHFVCFLLYIIIVYFSSLILTNRWPTTVPFMTPFSTSCRSSRPQMLSLSLALSKIVAVVVGQHYPHYRYKTNSYQLFSTFCSLFNYPPYKLVEIKRKFRRQKKLLQKKALCNLHFSHPRCSGRRIVKYCWLENPKRE